MTCLMNVKTRRGDTRDQHGEHGAGLRERGPTDGHVAGA